jgi:hypothetical protein
MFTPPRLRSLRSAGDPPPPGEGEQRASGNEGMTHTEASQFKSSTRHCALCPEGPYGVTITPIVLSAACKTQTYRSLRYLQLAVQCRRQANPFQTSIHTRDAGCFGARVYEYACSRLVFRLDRAPALIRSSLRMPDRASTRNAARIIQSEPDRPTPPVKNNGDH